MTYAMSRRSLMGGLATLPLASHFARAEAKEPIRIGVLAPLTGGGGPYGADIVKASKLAADQINAAGRIDLVGSELRGLDDVGTVRSAAAGERRQHADPDRFAGLRPAEAGRERESGNTGHQRAARDREFHGKTLSN